MRHHHIVPASLNHNVKAEIRDLTACVDLRRELTELTETANPTLTIGLGLFPDRHPLTWSITQTDTNRSRAFATHTEGDEERYRLAIRQIDNAEQHGVTLLIFPELTLSIANQEKIVRWLLRRCRDGSPCRIPLIILGSFHRTEDGHERNRAILLWGRDGTSIAKHDKYSPATLGELTERFIPGQSALLLHTPIGNLSLAICKDCIDAYADIWLEQLAPDWLLIPSLSDSVSQHLATTRKLWHAHRCISIVANQPISAEKIMVEAPPDSPYFGYIQDGEEKTGHTKAKTKERPRSRSEDIWTHTMPIPINSN